MPSDLPKSYKAAVIEEKGADIKIKEVPLELPKSGEILVKVLACGVCGSDVHAKKGEMGNSFPLVPGHEIVGNVVAVPDGEDHWKVGARVGGPWHGGHCSFCTPCKRGLFQMCDHEEINGITRSGGFAEYVLLRREAVVSVPEDVDPAAYAPLLCAGVTVFNSIRQLRIPPGQVVAVQGLGGLGHLALQYASKMGYKVVALSSSASKKDQAMGFGAAYFVDQSSEDAAEALKKLGGAACIVCTAGNPKLIGPLINGLGPNGTLLTIAPMPEVKISTMPLIKYGLSVKGWPSGSSVDSEDAIDFARAMGVNCMIEKFPLSEVESAMEHTSSGKVRFRGVLVMD